MSIVNSLRAFSRLKEVYARKVVSLYPLGFPDSYLTNISRARLSSLSDPDYQSPPPRKPRRFLLKFLFLTFASTATCFGLLYVSKSLRDALIKEYPPVKPILKTVESLIGGWYNASSISVSQLPGNEETLPFLSTKEDDSHNLWSEPFSQPASELPQVSEHHVEKKPVGLPTVDEVIQMTKDRAKAVPAIKTPADIDRVIKLAIQSVQAANASLGLLETATRNHIEALREAIRSGDSAKAREKKWENVSRLAARKDKAQEHANEAVNEASSQLEALRSVINQCKLNGEFLETDKLPESLNAYGDLQYDLAGSVQQVRKLQNELQMLMRYRDLISHTHDNLQRDLNELIDHVDLEKSGKGCDLTVGELNSLIVVAHNRINQLRSLIAEAEEKESLRLTSALEAQRRVDEEMIADHVQRELAKERVAHEIERLHWAVEAREATDRELRQALARHSDHLSHMLRLKQEEMEHQFAYRLREALAQEKTAFEAALSGWIQRMKAIEDVVDGRAELDRLAKETQALWIACEALACSLSSARPTGTQSSYPESNVTGPLNDFVEAVREAASTGNHPFALAILDKIPAEVVTHGVWSERGLKERFDKVYKVCRRVALVDETGGTLWTYALSYLQSILVLDVFSRKYLTQIPWLRTALPEPLLASESEVGEIGASTPGLDTFCLLRSAKSALSMDRKNLVEADGDDELNDSDDGIELAVRLLGQLRGQARLVAADWLADARLYLEARQAAQALLAYAAARGMSTFQKRL